VAAESALKAKGFEFDEFVQGFAPLRERLKPLERTMPWLTCGPLIFGNRFHKETTDGIYPAGDALSFVDPFTGTGLAGALLTGSLAGQCAAQAINAREYMIRSQRILGQPFVAATIFRAALQTRWAEAAAAVIPAAWLVRLTRPKKKNR
jgi:menaquinone-9 beta-reductase